MEFGTRTIRIGRQSIHPPPPNAPGTGIAFDLADRPGRTPPPPRRSTPLNGELPLPSQSLRGFRSVVPRGHLIVWRAPPPAARHKGAVQPPPAPSTRPGEPRRH